MKSELPSKGTDPVDPVTMIEEERAKSKAEWERKSPDEREESVRARLEDLYRAMGMPEEEIKRMHEGAYTEARAKWENEWLEKQAREAAGGMGEG